MYPGQFELRTEFETGFLPDVILPPQVINHVVELMKVNQQIALGNTSAQKLIEFVFFLRHPDLKGKVSVNDNRYREEREAIFFNVVAPALNSRKSSPQPPRPPGTMPLRKDTDLQEMWKLFKWFVNHTGRS